MKQIKNQTSENRKKAGITWMYGLLILVVAAIAMGGIYAKYYYEGKDGTGTVQARWFFFTSDRLGTVDSVVPIKAEGTTASVTFELRNYKSEMEWTEKDIQCSVTAIAEGTEPEEQANEQLHIDFNPDGVIPGGSKGSVKVTVDGMKVGYTYQISATGNAGYVETLLGSFSIVSNKAVYKAMSVEGNLIKLRVRTENVVGDAVLNIPAGLIPNKTETRIALDELNNYKNGSYAAEPGYKDTYSFASNANASQVYCFVIDQGGSYTIGEFGDITVGDIPAVEEPF